MAVARTDKYNRKTPTIYKDYKEPEFLKGATVQPSGCAKISNIAQNVCLWTQNAKFNTFLVFLTDFLNVLSHCVCAKFSKRNFGCAKELTFRKYDMPFISETFSFF